MMRHKLRQVCEIVNFLFLSGRGRLSGQSTPSTCFYRCTENI